MEVAGQRQEGRSGTISEAAWVSILAALVALLGFLLALAGMPEATVEIVLADAIFVALVAIFIYRVETHLDAEGRRTLFKGRPGLTLIVTSVALGVIAGALAELASSANDPPVTRALVIYEKQIREEVLGPLRETSASAFKAPGSRRDPDLYVKSARELSAAYQLASEVLAGIEPARRGDQALHSLLGVRLHSVGEAYAHLGNAVFSGVDESQVDAARARIQGSIKDLREVEEALEDRGYRVSLAS